MPEEVDKFEKLTAAANEIVKEQVPEPGRDGTAKAVRGDEGDILD